MTGPKPGHVTWVGADRPGVVLLCVLQDFWSGRAEAAVAVSGTCVLPGCDGLRDIVCAVAVRMGEGVKVEGSAETAGFLHWPAGVGVDAVREIAGVLECGGAAGVFGRENETRALSADSCVLRGGVRDSIWPVPARPGEEPEFEGCEGLLQAGVEVDVGAGATREVPGELGCGGGRGAPCILGSEKATRMPSPDLEGCRWADVKGLVEGYCARSLVCISSASARITFM